LDLVAQAEPYIGKYYSQDYVRRQILRQTDEEIIEQDYLIEKEIEEGVIPDPNAPAEAPPEAPGQPGAVPDAMGSGGSPLEPEAPEAPETPSGGEI
jgi:hypothetical protein